MWAECQAQQPKRMLTRVHLFVSLWTIARQAPLSMGFFRQEHGAGCHFLLQGIFLTQGSNPHFWCLLNCRWILYLLSHQGSPEYEEKFDLCGTWSTVGLRGVKTKEERKAEGPAEQKQTKGKEEENHRILGNSCRGTVIQREKGQLDDGLWKVLNINLRKNKAHR